MDNGGFVLDHSEFCSSLPQIPVDARRQDEELKLLKKRKRKLCREMYQHRQTSVKVRNLEVNHPADIHFVA